MNFRNTLLKFYIGEIFFISILAWREGMSKDITVSQLKGWGRHRKEKTVPAFLLPREEREKLIHQKLHHTGKPRRND
jgi:hypothetical protein